MTGINNKSDVLVSVVILCYNQEDTIKQTLDSIAEQKVDYNFEILIGDDFSSDNTFVICKKFITNNKNIEIKIVPKKKNLGLIQNYVQCVKLAKGKFITQCAGDDYWCDKLKLQKQISFLLENPDYGLIHTGYKNFLVKTNTFEEEKNIEKLEDTFENLLLKNQIAAVTPMYKKIYFDQALKEGLYSKGFLMEDYPLWLSISLKAKIKYLSDKTCVRREQENSASMFLDKKKRILFDFSTFTVKTLFISENNISPNVIKMVSKEALDLLENAYLHGLRKVGVGSFLFLLKNNKTNLSSFKYLIGSQIPMVRRLYYNFK